MKFKFLNCIFLIYFIFGGVLYSDEKRQVEEKEVEIIDGKAYVKGENKPFSGNIIVRYDSGEISSVYALKEGLRQGITNYYHKNGNVKKYIQHGSSGARTEYDYDLNGKMLKATYYNKSGEIDDVIDYTKKNVK